MNELIHGIVRLLCILVGTAIGCGAGYVTAFGWPWKNDSKPTKDQK